MASGPRPNEALALRLGAVDLATGDAHLATDVDTEKRRERMIRLSTGTLSVVRGQLARVGEYTALCDVTPAPDGYLFSPEPDTSSPYDPDWAGQAFTRWVSRARRDGVADLPKSLVLYDMRHDGITRLLAASHPVADVARRFGTSARMIYATYAHAIPGHDDQMAGTLEALLDQ